MTKDTNQPTQPLLHHAPRDSWPSKSPLPAVERYRAGLIVVLLTALIGGAIIGELRLRSGSLQTQSNRNRCQKLGKS